MGRFNVQGGRTDRTIYGLANDKVDVKNYSRYFASGPLIEVSFTEKRNIREIW
jgi:hypothetical protein